MCVRIQGDRIESQGHIQVTRKDTWIEGCDLLTSDYREVRVRCSGWLDGLTRCCCHYEKSDNLKDKRRAYFFCLLFSYTKEHTNEKGLANLRREVS